MKLVCHILALVSLGQDVWVGGIQYLCPVLSNLHLRLVLLTLGDRTKVWQIIIEVPSLSVADQS